MKKKKEETIEETRKQVEAALQKMKQDQCKVDVAFLRLRIIQTIKDVIYDSRFADVTSFRDTPHEEEFIDFVFELSRRSVMVVAEFLSAKFPQSLDDLFSDAYDC